MEIMTTDRCLEQIKEAAKKRDEMIDRAKEFYRKRAQAVLNEWAYDNARFGVCDILEFSGSMIEVDRITGRMGVAGKPYVAYQGPVLTKQMKYRKDKERKDFYDDGRDIRLVRKAELTIREGMKQYCPKHCTGYRETGGKCFCDERCQEFNEWYEKAKKGEPQ